MTLIDSKPLATLLKERTLEIHDSVATSEGANLLTSGNLSREEYTRYLMMLWHVYDTLEKALERHATHPALEPTYNPTLLERAPSLAADISHLLDVDESSWKYHPIHTNLIAAYPSPLSDYVQRIEELSNSSDPSALLAHSYVRYLGDLSGGQTIRHTLAKAYNLDEAAGFGLSFYRFKELRSSKVASQGEMKRIKEWFREGMNVAGERIVHIKATVTEESQRAFLFNSQLFNILRLEEQEETLTSKQGRRSLSAYPLSQILAVFGAVCLAHFFLVTSSAETAYYPLSRILAVFGAAYLAHFILVVGRFTGIESSHCSFLTIKHWFASHL